MEKNMSASKRIHLEKDEEEQYKQMLLEGETNLNTIGTIAKGFKVAIRFENTKDKNVKLIVKVFNYECISMRKLFEFMNARCSFIEEAHMRQETKMTFLELVIFPFGIDSVRSRRGDENKFLSMKPIPAKDFEEEYGVNFEENGQIMKIGTPYIAINDPEFPKTRDDLKVNPLPLSVKDTLVLESIKKFLRYVHSPFEDIPLTFDPELGFVLDKKTRKPKNIIVRSLGFASLNIAMARTLFLMNPIAMEEILVYPRHRRIEVIWRPEKRAIEELWLIMASVKEKGRYRSSPRDFTSMRWSTPLDQLGVMDDNPICEPLVPQTTLKSTTSESSTSSSKKVKPKKYVLERSKEGRVVPKIPLFKS